MVSTASDNLKYFEPAEVDPKLRTRNRGPVQSVDLAYSV